MGAGASVADQKAWGEKILAAKSRQQKLEVMRQLTKAVQASGMGQEDRAAQKLQAMQRGKAARAPVKGGTNLQGAFATFANFGKSKKQKGAGDMIDSSRFRKMIKNAKLICKGMSNKNGRVCGNHCDQLHVKFCKAGGKSTKKQLHFDDFVALMVPELANCCKCEAEDICQKICQNGKPKNSGTKAQYNKFYDDKSTWTGVATRGGPSTSGDQITLSGMMNRKEGDMGN